MLSVMVSCPHCERPLNEHEKPCFKLIKVPGVGFEVYTARVVYRHFQNIPAEAISHGPKHPTDACMYYYCPDGFEPYRVAHYGKGEDTSMDIYWVTKGYRERARSLSL